MSSSLDEESLEQRLGALEEAFDDLDLQVMHMIQIGTVVETDPVQARIRVKIDDVETNWLPWATARAHGVSFWSMPAEGEQVAVLSPGGDYADGIAVPAVFQNAQPAPSSDPKFHIVRFDDNTSVSFDGTKTLLRIACGGDIEIEAKGPIRIVGATVQLTGGGIAVASAGVADISGEQIRLNDEG